MNRKIDSNYGDTERSRIITLAQIYERTADELAFWNAKAAEELYRKIIYMLIPLAPLNYNLVRMLQKMGLKFFRVFPVVEAQLWDTN